MDAGTQTIERIFGAPQQFQVPLFQRPYVWKRKEQLEPLWEDVRRVAERVLRGEPRPHFLGAIVLEQVPNQTGYLQIRLVIDGQQRLTTLQLMLEAFSDACRELKAEGFDRALLQLTRNDTPLSTNKDDRFKVWPTNADRAIFCQVMDASTPDELQPEGAGDDPIHQDGHAIAVAYEFFYSAIKEWLDPGSEGLIGRVEALFGALYRNVRLVVIDLGKEDDAQVIFETLNARGTALLPSDLVKNFLFLQAARAGADIDTLYATYWQPFDEHGSYWREEVVTGRLRRARIDTFLQYYLSLRRGEDILASQLYSGYRELITDIDGPRVEEELRDLKACAAVFKSFTDETARPRQRLFFERLDLMDVTTLYPFLLYFFREHGHDLSGRDAVMTDLESFLLRRTVCRLTTKAYNRLFLDLVRQCRAAAGQPVAAVRDFLLSSSSDSGRWPDDEEFRTAWITYPLYRSLVRARVRMILEAIERQLHSKLTESVIFNEQLTVEHLLPQKWQESWPLPACDDRRAAADRREAALHTIGNLTLVNDKLNPYMSNGPWHRKLKAILKYGTLALNRDLVDHETWDETTIRARGEALFAIARQIWPHPGKPAEVAGG